METQSYEWIPLGSRATCQRCRKWRLLLIQQPGNNILCRGCCKVIDRGCSQQCFALPGVDGGHHACCTEEGKRANRQLDREYHG